jgi:dTDP-4-amino-4,6-dideoxygalactose transaminase
MKKNKINLGIQYPYPLHKMLAYKNNSHTKLDNSEKLSKKIFSLPIYPMLEEEKVNKIINILNKI